MGKGKRRAMPPARAKGTKDRHKGTQRARFDHLAPPMDVLAAKPVVPKSKHHSYFEFVENKNKKKKLELQDTPNKSPPPGFEFVPNGNAKLTKACKEISREKDAMVFLVSGASDGLSRQVNRLGIHVRQTIVDEARASMSDLLQSGAISPDGRPEPIPESQAEYHLQADEALRDLFPRIPNTDRQIIIDHAFTRRLNAREQPVGFSDDIPLARRVQLAVLAHIRHAHTRYDELLREAGWQAARKAVEALCLDIIVKWRGDEETGRDQLDEILREVVVISDSEDDDSDVESTDDSTAEESGCSSEPVLITQPPATTLSETVTVDLQSSHESDLRTVEALAPARRLATHAIHYTQRSERNDRKNQRGFKRYRAWQDAIIRSREAEALSPDFRGMGLDERTSSRRQDYDVFNQSHQSTAYIGGEGKFHFPAAGSRVSSNQVNRTLPVYPRPIGNDSCPTHANRATEILLQQCGKELHPPTTGHLMNSSLSSSKFMMDPFSNSPQDMPVPSIEPASPETMKPAFIRTVRPRQQDPMDHVSSRTQEPFHNVRTHLAMADQARISSGYGPRLVISDHGISDQRPHPSDFVADGRMYESEEQIENSFVQSKATYVEPRPRQYWTRSYEPPVHFDKPADRIVVNASRPGTRTNPVIMEDRGGFYEKVALPPVPREPAYHRHGVTMNSSRLDFDRTRESYRLPLSRESARPLEDDNWGYSNVEAIPLTPLDSHHQQSYYSPVHLQSRKHPRQSDSDDKNFQSISGRHFAEKGWLNEEFKQRQSHEDPFPLPTRTSHRNAKRPLVNDHYQNASRAPRPRSRQPDDVIVLD